MTYLRQVPYLRLRDELGVCLSYCCLSGTTCVLVVVQYTAVYLVYILSSVRVNELRTIKKRTPFLTYIGKQPGRPPSPLLAIY